MSKYRIIIKSNGIIVNEHFVDKVSDVDLTGTTMRNVTIMGSAKSIKQIQRNQKSLAKKGMSKFSSLRNKVVYE